MLTTAIVTMALATAAPAKPAVTLTQVKSFSNFRATAVASSPVGGRFAVASEDRQVRVVDSKTMATVHQLGGHPMTVYALAFSDDGKYLLTGDESARIWLWDAKTGKKLREFPREKGHTRGIQSFAFSGDGKRFVSVGKDDVIKAWNTAGGHPVATIEGKGANFYGVAMLPNGSIAAGTLAEGMRLYSSSYSLAAKLECPGGQGANDIAVNGAGTLGLTAGRDGAVTVWDLKKRERLAAMPGHSDWVLGVAVAPNGRVGASSSTDSSVALWDLKAFKKIASIGDRAFVDSLVAFTSDGKYLLTTDSGNVLQAYQIDPPQK